MNHDAHQVNAFLPAPGAMKLAWARLSKTFSWRMGLALSVLTALFLSLMVLVLRQLDGVGPFPGVVRRAAMMGTWTSGALLALANAKGDIRHDGQKDPWLLMAQQHGVSGSAMRVSSNLVASVATGLLVLVAAVPVLLSSSATSGSWKALSWQLMALGPLLLLSLVVGLIGGWFARWLSEVFPNHGRSALLLAVLVPWMLDGWLLKSESHVTSIPGLVSWLGEWVAATGRMAWW